MKESLEHLKFQESKTVLFVRLIKKKTQKLDAIQKRFVRVQLRSVHPYSVMCYVKRQYSVKFQI